MQPHASLVSPDQTWAQASKKDSHATRGEKMKNKNAPTRHALLTSQMIKHQQTSQTPHSKKLGHSLAPQSFTEEEALNEVHCENH